MERTGRLTGSAMILRTDPGNWARRKGFVIHLLTFGKCPRYLDLSSSATRRIRIDGQEQEGDSRRTSSTPLSRIRASVSCKTLKACPASGESKTLSPSFFKRYQFYILVAMPANEKRGAVLGVLASFHRNA